MQEIIDKIVKEARDGLQDTQGEFAKLESLSPLTFILDADKENPVEDDEVEKLKSVNLTELDIGKRYALLRFTNGKYLVLGEVE